MRAILRRAAAGDETQHAESSQQQHKSCWLRHWPACGDGQGGGDVSPPAGDGAGGDGPVDERLQAHGRLPSLEKLEKLVEFMPDPESLDGPQNSEGAGHAAIDGAGTYRVWLSRTS